MSHDPASKPERTMNSRLAGSLLVFILSSAAFVGPALAQAQAPKKKLDPTLLICGQKVLVDDQSCRAGEVLEITGSCLQALSEPGETRPKGIQYNCLKRK